MNSFLRNTLAIVSGLMIGSTVNMGIIMVSSLVIPPPEGADVTTMEGLTASIHLFEPKHFVMPFLAHAFGTFSGALVSACIVKFNRIRFSLIIGAGFLVGGISNAFIIPAPIWFLAVDILFAYLPISFFAAWLINNLDKK